MAAVTADRMSRERDVHLKCQDTKAIATAATIYVGAMVDKILATNRLTNADNVADHRFAGICEKIINDSGSVISAGTGNTGGTVKAVYSYGHTVLLNVRTAARTYDNINKNVFCDTNNEVTDTTGAGTAGLRVSVGYIVEFEASNLSTAWVALRRFSSADAV